MALSFIVLLGVVVGGVVVLALLGLGAYALYEGFTREGVAHPWFGSETTARIVGFASLGVGLSLICALVGIFAFLFLGVSL